MSRRITQREARELKKRVAYLESELSRVDYGVHASVVRVSFKLSDYDAGLIEGARARRQLRTHVNADTSGRLLTVSFHAKGSEG